MVEWENGDQILRGVREVVPVVRSAFQASSISRLGSLSVHSGVRRSVVGHHRGAALRWPSIFCVFLGVVESRASITEMKKWETS